MLGCFLMVKIGLTWYDIKIKTLYIYRKIALDGLLNIHIKAAGCHRDRDRNTDEGASCIIQI